MNNKNVCLANLANQNRIGKLLLMTQIVYVLNYSHYNAATAIDPMKFRKWNNFDNLFRFKKN